MALKRKKDKKDTPAGSEKAADKTPPAEPEGDVETGTEEGAPPDAVEPAEVEAQPPPPAEESVAEAPPSEPKGPEPPAASASLPRYRVSKEWRGSYGGSMTILSEGKVIDPRGHGGMPGIERLRKAGVELEEIAD